jgi:hypothetical protein
MENQKWAYLISRIVPGDMTLMPDGKPFTEAQLESLGNEGWELVAVTPHDSSSVNAFFKRRKSDPARPL